MKTFVVELKNEAQAEALRNFLSQLPSVEWTEDARTFAPADSSALLSRYERAQAAPAFQNPQWSASFAI